jgi:hypothetical protein
MTELRPLLDERSEADDRTRVLINAAKNMPLPVALFEEVWASLVPQLPAANLHEEAAIQRAAAASAERAVAVRAAASKLGLVAFVTGAAALCWLLLGSHAGSRTVPPLARSAAVAPPQAPTASAASAALAEPAPVSDGGLTQQSASAEGPATAKKTQFSAKIGASAQPSPRAKSEPAAATNSADMLDESRIVAAARSALRSGNGAGALTLLSDAQRRFGNGVLSQEREVLTIEALQKSGQSAAATARARSFLASYPKSPYADRVRTMLGL